MNKQDKKELRSEKVRNIIGTIPHNIVRYGTTVMAIILTGLFFAIYCIPYPENLKVNVKAIDTQKANILIPYYYINTIEVGMNVEMEFDGYPTNQYGYKRGTISSISKEIIILQEVNYFSATVLTSNRSYIINKGMKGKASILVSNKTILYHLFE